MSHPYSKRNRKPRLPAEEPPQEKTADRKPVLRIHFKDEGQDFLWWEIDGDGIVTGCNLQEWLWVGCVVTNEPPTALKRGDLVAVYSGDTQRCTTIRYPLTKVEKLP